MKTDISGFFFVFVFKCHYHTEAPCAQWYKWNDSFHACGRYFGALRSYFACRIGSL